jgi:hypothetical protein
MASITISMGPIRISVRQLARTSQFPRVSDCDFLAQPGKTMGGSCYFGQLTDLGHQVHDGMLFWRVWRC